MSKFQNENQRQQADFIKILKNSYPETLSEVGGAPPHYELPPRVASFDELIILVCVGEMSPPPTTFPHANHLVFASNTLLWIHIKLPRAQNFG